MPTTPMTLFLQMYLNKGFQYDVRRNNPNTELHSLTNEFQKIERQVQIHLGSDFQIVKPLIN